jgi:hypothetical protein
MLDPLLEVTGDISTKLAACMFMSGVCAAGDHGTWVMLWTYCGICGGARWTSATSDTVITRTGASIECPGNLQIYSSAFGQTANVEHVQASRHRMCWVVSSKQIVVCNSQGMRSAATLPMRLVRLGADATESYRPEVCAPAGFRVRATDRGNGCAPLARILREGPRCAKFWGS